MYMHPHEWVNIIIIMLITDHGIHHYTNMATRLAGNWATVEREC